VHTPIVNANSLEAVEPARIRTVDRGIRASEQQRTDHHLPTAGLTAAGQIHTRQQDLPTPGVKAMADRWHSQTFCEGLTARDDLILGPYERCQCGRETASGHPEMLSAIRARLLCSR
jgi:hypothetical protein